LSKKLSKRTKEKPRVFKTLESLEILLKEKDSDLKEKKEGL
jgi:hypothetical protein